MSNKTVQQVENSESLHELDWKENKPNDSGLENTVRFQTLMKLIQKHDPAIVFDIGCGSGFLGGKIKKWKPEVILHGCDISTSALEKAKLNFDKIWKTNLNCEDIPAESTIYDVVICSEVLRPLQNAPFCPIPASGSNFNPQNTQCIPVVKIFAFLGLEQN